MGRRRNRHMPTNELEFELDLAPLLAVVVKLVPVLLVSSAFVQMMVIETDIPQAVKQAIQQNQDDKRTPQIKLYVLADKSVKVQVLNTEKPVEIQVPANAGTPDYKALQTKFQELKDQFPQVYRMEVFPERTVAYQDIVKIMDEARKTRKQEQTWPVLDKTTNQQVNSPLMFPDVVFGNVLEG
ncbi:MAG: biopolymer transporter ExbD [Pseudobdellovibrionaceae bacterium]